jgi:hypothetical protein
MDAVQSAKADFANFQRRIMPFANLMGDCAAPSGATEVDATTAESLANCAGFNRLNRDCHRRPEGRRCAWYSPAPDQSAQADFANFQRRIHSLRRGRGVYRSDSQ